MRTAVAAVAVMLIAVGAWFAIGPGAGPPIGSCASTSFAVVEAADAPPFGTIAWRDATVLDPADDFQEEIVLDVEAFNGRFVAIGRRSNGPQMHAFVLRSSDGVEWAQDPEDADRFAGTELAHLVVVDRRLFALGSASTDDRGGTRAAVWLTDDGVAWSEATGPFNERWATALAGGDGDLLMFGSEADSGATVAWRSADGTSWEEQALELPVPPGEGRVSSVALDGGGWLGVGSISRGADAASAAVVWRSHDGRSWSCEVLDSRDFTRADAVELHVSGARALAVGSATRGCGLSASCPGFGMTWSAHDDEWATARTESHAGPPISSAGFASDSRGFLLVRGGTAWSSADGTYWTELDQLAGLTSVGAVAAVVVDGSRVVAVGSSNDGSNADAWLATGDLAP